MDIFFLCILLLPFLYINYKIIETDIKEKKIPNSYLKYLLVLLPIWYIYLIYFNVFGDIQILTFVLQTFLTFFVSFCIFHFGLWGAGDAKYLLVLSLFIPYIGIIAFIGNIAYITLIFLLLYFIWFWIGPNLWNKTRRKNIFYHMWNIKKEKIIIENKHKTYLQIIKEILKIMNIFFIIFISIRLIRIHIIDYISETYNISIVDLFIHQYGIYILLGLFGCVLLISLGIRLLISYFKAFTGNNNTFLFLLFINIIGIIFFIYEYIINPNNFIDNIILIFSLYLGLYIFFKMLLFAYKLVFILQEESLININKLEEGMIIDKNFLKKSFKGQKEIFTLSEISALDISIDKEIITFLQDKYKQVNSYIASHSPTGKHEPFETIQIKKTFAFGTFICLGFITSVIFELYNFNIIRFLLSLL